MDMILFVLRILAEKLQRFLVVKRKASRHKNQLQKEATTLCAVLILDRSITCITFFLNFRFFLTTDLFLDGSN